MKRLIVCAGLLVASTALLAQGAPKSPAAKESATIGGHAVTITYSSPRVNGREGKIFTKDGLISQNPHYPVWRAGANAATALHTEGDIKLGDIKVPKGDYTLFVDISDPDNWVLIVNTQTGQGGLSYDGSQDLGKTKMKMSKPLAMVENLKYIISGGTFILVWENHVVFVFIS